MFSLPPPRHISTLRKAVIRGTWTSAKCANLDRIGPPVPCPVYPYSDRMAGIPDDPQLRASRDEAAPLRPPVRCDERVILNPSAAILLKTCFQASKGGRASV